MLGNLFPSPGDRAHSRGRSYLHWVHPRQKVLGPPGLAYGEATTSWGGGWSFLGCSAKRTGAWTAPRLRPERPSPHFCLLGVSLLGQPLVPSPWPHSGCPCEGRGNARNHKVCRLGPLIRGQKQPSLGQGEESSQPCWLKSKPKAHTGRKAGRAHIWSDGRASHLLNPHAPPQLSWAAQTRLQLGPHVPAS